MSTTPAPLHEPPTGQETPRLRDLHVFRDYVATLRQPEFRAIFGSVLVVLTVGTVAFRVLEGWSLLDSLYFCVVTLATIGYGDLAPTTAAAKLFTIFYVFVGVGILGVFISAVSRASMHRTLERTQHLASRPMALREDSAEHER